VLYGAGRVRRRAAVGRGAGASLGGAAGGADCPQGTRRSGRGRATRVRGRTQGSG
jgi:hypothetical protein